MAITLKRSDINGIPAGHLSLMGNRHLSSLQSFLCTIEYYKEVNSNFLVEIDARNVGEGAMVVCNL